MTMVRACLLLGVVMACSHQRAHQSVDDDSPVLVDGDPITSSELQLHLDDVRATESVSAANLSFRLRAAALRSAVRAKVEQQIAREHGLGADITFGSFRSQLEQENTRRARSLAAGEPIYGPQQLSVRDFYRYQATTRVHELEAALRDTVLAPSTDELHAAYARHKESFHKGYNSRLRIWLAPYRSLAGASTTKDVALAELTRIHAARLAGTKVQAAAFVQVVDSQIRSHVGGGINDPLLLRAATLPTLALTNVVDTGIAFEVVEVLERQDLGTATMDEAKSALLPALVDAKYEAYVSERVRSAHVRLMPTFYAYVPG